MTRPTPRQLREIRQLLAKTLPYERWLVLHPRDPEEAKMYKDIRRMLEQTDAKYNPRSPFRGTQ